MNARLAVRVISVAAAVMLPMATVAATAQGAVQQGPAVLHVGQIDRQDVATRPPSEPDTLAEPDVAADPHNPQIAVAVAHDSRYANGGAVDISYAWTHDGGRAWHHAPVPGVTTAQGGVWPRASDPVVAFGPDGSVYLSILVFQPFSCPTGIVVLRSTDGGQTWGTPVLADHRTSCTVSDDKNWLVVDTHPSSPHYGRIYQFWTPFLFTAAGKFIGDPQWVRFSDDKGQHWSAAYPVTPPQEGTQDSQPMIQPNGTITDAYQRFGAGGGEQPEHPMPGAESQGTQQGAPGLGAGQSQAPGAASPAVNTGVDVVARTSYDGGKSWSAEHLIVSNIGVGPRGIRCCLPSATADPQTGRLYAAWIGAGSGEPVLLSKSSNGVSWSPAMSVSRDGRAASMTHVNVDVTAGMNRVFVAYGTRNAAIAGGRYVQQKLNYSYDGGATFGRPIALGPLSDLTYAAQAGGAFPGDYIGTSVVSTRLYVVWCRSYPPPDNTGKFHQTMYAATLRP